jgi:nitrogen fixation protein NifB
VITPGIAQIELMRRHPCFNGEAHDRVGRVHLPVAPRCNIQCNFCERRVCANLTIQHPGWTAKVLSVREAVELVRSIVHSGEENFVVGVAGPGDPLANEETFEALRAIHDQYPQILKCLSTNGLLLGEKLPEILGAGVSALTVTVNAPDSAVGKGIYSWVRYQGTVYRGQEAAEVLLTSQFRGIKMAVDAGLSLKVNTVLIPGVNDACLVRLTLLIREAGVRLMNIMPLIPSGKMRNYRAPTCDELRRARQACEAVIPQFYRCEQCRADVVYLP